MTTSSGRGIRGTPAERELQHALDLKNAGNLRGALTLLEPLKEQFPDEPALLLLLAATYVEMALYDSASKVYKRTTVLAPRSERASVGLFHSLWVLGKSDMAFDEMRRFMSSNKSPEYEQLLKDLLEELKD